MDGRAALSLSAYGVPHIDSGGEGSGCQGPNCGRKPGTILMNQAETPVDAKYMQLSLKVHGMPLLFENDDNFNWNWSADKKTLHIENAETKTDDALGYAQKEVYDIPAENIKEWAPSEGEQWKN